jgi:hypothetical protein
LASPLGSPDLPCAFLHRLKVMFPIDNLTAYGYR